MPEAAHFFLFCANLSFLKGEETGKPGKFIFYFSRKLSFLPLKPMRFTVLGSGSTGNAVLITAGKTKVLVDAGLSAKEILRRLVCVGEDCAGLDAVLITHEHSDHAGGLRVLLKTLGCPVYISGATRDAYIREKARTDDEPRKRAEALSGRTEEISSSRDFRVGEIDFHPFTVP
ncbi:MAG TPA: MBL fold metallo-hydrolase, partial [Pyrinomonadaceae bacterium]